MMISMNKIVIDVAKKKVENFVGRLEVKGDLELICEGSNKIEIEFRKDVCLKIVLLDDSFVDLSIVDSSDFIKRDVMILQYNRSEMVYQEKFASNGPKDLLINNIINGNGNKSKIEIKCIAYQDIVNMKVMVKALKNTVDNLLVEDVKGILQGGSIVVKPEMEIDTNEVVANHFVTLGAIDEEVLIYLEGKGLNRKQATELILEGFLK